MEPEDVAEQLIILPEPHHVGDNLLSPLALVLAAHIDDNKLSVLDARVSLRDRSSPWLPGGQVPRALSSTSVPLVQGPRHERIAAESLSIAAGAFAAFAG